MNIKTFALSAVVVAALGAPIANAATVEPAGFATGFVTAVNEAAGTIVVEGVTIKVTRSQLGDATLGSEVDVAYVINGGRMNAIAVTPIEPGDDAELVE
jgi:hypothetical protein